MAPAPKNFVRLASRRWKQKPRLPASDAERVAEGDGPGEREATGGRNPKADGIGRQDPVLPTLDLWGDADGVGQVFKRLWQQTSADGSEQGNVEQPNFDRILFRHN